MIYLDDAFDKAEKLLGLYRRLATDDTTTDLLRIFLERLPKEGKAALVSDILAIGRDDQKLRTLRNHLVEAILKPSKLFIFYFSSLAILNTLLFL